MPIDLKKIVMQLAALTPEERDKLFPPPPKIPAGWVDIEEHLPMMLAIDYFKGGTVYKVKDKNGNEFVSSVMDHSIWYYLAKEAGVTHWWNELKQK